MIFKIQYPSFILKINVFDGQLLHVVVSKLKAHLAIPGFLGFCRVYITVKLI